MAARRMRFNCDGCRRAGPGCDYDCEITKPNESEAATVKSVIAIKHIKEVTNIAYPVRRPGIWDRIAGYFAKIIKF